MKPLNFPYYSLSLSPLLSLPLLITHHSHWLMYKQNNKKSNKSVRSSTVLCLVL